MPPIKRILVPTDWSELSNWALNWAASLAREHAAQVLLLHVVPLPAVMYGPPSEGYLDHLLGELCRVKPADPHVHVHHLLLEGDPATAIASAARENNCDMIVMGTHGRRGLGRVLMGSVAERVVRTAPCPVLVVKAGIPGNSGSQGGACVESPNRSAATRS